MQQEKKHLIYRRKTIQMMYFSSENMKFRQKWNNIFEVLKK